MIWYDQYLGNIPEGPAQTPPIVEQEEDEEVEEEEEEAEVGGASYGCAHVSLEC